MFSKSQETAGNRDQMALTSGDFSKAGQPPMYTPCPTAPLSEGQANYYPQLPYAPGHVDQQAPPPPPQSAVVAQQPQGSVVQQQPGVVVVNQPSGAANWQAVQARGEWGSGIFGCFEDMKSCMCAILCSPFFACCLAKRMGENCCTPYLAGGLVAMRSVLRTRHNIQGSISGDCCTIFFCGNCAMCQMSREMDKWGYPDNGCC